MSVFDEFNTPNSAILFPVVERPVSWMTRDAKAVATRDHKALVRVMHNNEPKLLNIVGSGYKLIHNRELFNTVESVIEQKFSDSALDGVRVTDKVSHYGRVCFREYVFPNITTRLKTGPSEIAFRMIVQNGYGGSALRVHAGAIDFFCTNGMIRGEYTSAYNKHTSRLSLHNFSGVVDSAVTIFDDSKELWQRWLDTPVKHQAAMDLFRELASSSKLAEGLGDQYMRERETRGDNLWALYSTLTYYSSHNEGQFALRSSTEEADSVSSIMLRREMDVAKWTQSKEWLALESA